MNTYRYIIPIKKFTLNVICMQNKNKLMVRKQVIKLIFIKLLYFVPHPLKKQTNKNNRTNLEDKTGFVPTTRQ